MMKINLRMPRIIYVNNREQNENSGTPVKRILPRLKPVFNLRRYVIDERIFESSLKYCVLFSVKSAQILRNPTKKDLLKFSKSFF